MDIIAHRGASHDAPENTLAALELAWQQGADAAEVDIQITRTGQLIVLHDPDTARTTGHHAVAAQSTLKELRQLDAGRWKGASWTGIRIPTLAEAFDMVPRGKRLFVEIKCGAECVPEWIQVFRRSGLRPQQVVPIGFDRTLMGQLKTALPRLETCLVARFRRSWRSARWTPTLTQMIQPALEAGLDALDLGAHRILNPAQIRQIHLAGLKVYVWTVDAPAKARKFQSAGIDGLTTNRPGWLRQQLEKKQTA
jgi:glycerophosphoryl diester phosphodiesterase